MDQISYIDQILEIKQSSYDKIPNFLLELDCSIYTVKFKVSDNQYIAESSGSYYLLQVLKPPAGKFFLIESALKYRES